MAAIEPPLNGTVQAIYRLHEQREAATGGHRLHLGASVIGHACERHLWLHFHWAGREQFDGRMLRLFDYGKQLEPRLVAELRAVGVQVHDADEFGRQFRVSAVSGHFGGSLDGAAVGLAEAPKTWHVLEFKSHSDKSFADLQAKGVRESKPMHWAQMQVYMGLTGMDRALYLAENKNTSALYQERIHADPGEFALLLGRAERVIRAAEPPPRISADPAWRQCKFCCFHGQCHGQEAPEVNCRTCAHSTARTDIEGGVWQCELQRMQIGETLQRSGCAGHRYIPILLERIGQQGAVTMEPDGNATVQYATPAGETFANGAPPALSSVEIRAARCKDMLGDPRIAELKAQFPKARLVA